MPSAASLQRLAALLAVGALAGAVVARGQDMPATPLPASPLPASPLPGGDVTPVHDPVLIRAGEAWHVFSTGLGPGPHGILSARRSRDMVTWEKGAAPFSRIPDWAAKAIPGATNLWAPDISFVNGRYRLYYSVSTFGSNRSAIGLATAATLDPDAPGYGWRDEGLVVQSRPGDDFNAIDPAFLANGQGRHWLALGSFWSGLKLFRLDPATGKPLDPAAKPIALASRPVPAGAPSIVEAPFLFARDGWYWLIASYDYCCKGTASTYYTVIGRSRTVEGPYRGKDGSSMLAGGGTILLRADLQEKERFRGPGHAGHFRDADGTDWIVYHAYDRAAKGAPRLRIARLNWGTDGWPVAEPLSGEIG
ncbi:arabinan endo-1,5-alpha-L-arabinosidase [Sphingomonas sp.]|uniref:arabinan endo-1,5-alpha-L-arabinosidase n=1 Tax=Sphingomonas sp. TaxID=28214 RepID=UPI002BD3AC39|nr:arabinan endo-1,5-alpha-L-arabinosidase [Sphingomonas sp.]HTG37246.1 arabinan endo-1,5-alpha-L-arabinosidase [Sphingomonas sp.]